MNNNDEPRWKPVPEETVELTIRLPRRAIGSLERVARDRDLSCEAVARMYVGDGLRADLERMFAERAMAAAEAELRERLPEDEIPSAMRAIRSRIDS